MNQYTVLIVDDDKNINHMLAEYLTSYGFHTLSAYDGQEGLALFRGAGADILVLDVMMPNVDGIEVCREIRKTSFVPILMLTARGDETDKLIGLELGADDYITKPFSPKEIAVRLKTILRRCSGDKVQEDHSGEKLTFEDMVIDLASCVVTVHGKEVSLTATEFKMLAALAQQPGRVLSRLQIAEKAHGNYFEGYDRTIDAHIKNIRQKISAVHPEQNYIQTVRSLGYKLARQ